MEQSSQPERSETPKTVARASDCEIIVSRTFDSQARAVFDAWTRPELFRQWWAPKSMGAVLSTCQIDARTGGGYRITYSGEGSASATFFGSYIEATPPSRLVWTNEESHDGPVTTVTFDDQGERTLLTLSERYRSVRPSTDAAAGLQAMLAEQFDQLDELLASLRQPT